LNKQGIGENDGTWGSIANTQYDLIDKSLAGALDLALTSSDVTLTTSNGEDDQARNMSLILSGTLTADVTVFVPAVDKLYIVDAEALVSGDYKVSIQTTGLGDAIAFRTKDRAILRVDGDDVKTVVTDRYKEVKMFSGPVAEIETGWQLCDGTNSTPDLRDRFIVGATQDDAGVAKTNITGSLTQSGTDASSVTVDAGGDHDHGGSAGDTALTEAQMAEHYHFAFNTTNGSSGTAVVSGSTYANRSASLGGSNNYSVRGTSSTASVGKTSSAGSSETHTHTITSSGTHTHTASVTAIPDYYALCFIMRV
jgi:hypothetical protein